MPNLLLKARLALELPEINRALDTLIEKLPAPVRPAAGHTITAGGKRLRPPDRTDGQALRLQGQEDLPPVLHA